MFELNLVLATGEVEATRLETPERVLCDDYSPKVSPLPLKPRRWLTRKIPKSTVERRMLTVQRQLSSYFDQRPHHHTATSSVDPWSGFF